jgi:hypothetical protein
MAPRRTGKVRPAVPTVDQGGLFGIQSEILDDIGQNKGKTNKGKKRVWFKLSAQYFDLDDNEDATIGCGCVDQLQFNLAANLNTKSDEVMKEYVKTKSDLELSPTSLKI